MGVHLYTNEAWTDSGRIYRNSKNLWSAGNVAIALGERFKNISLNLPNGTYTFKAKYSSENTGSVTIGFFDENNTIHTQNLPQVDGTVTTTYTGIITAINIYSAAGYTVSSSYAADFTEIMMNVGNIALPYEPYNVVDWYTNNGHGYTSGAWD